MWGEQLRASQRALAAYPPGISAARQGVGARGPAGGARRRGRRTATATPGLEAALNAERVALQTHVAAVGQLGDRESRAILGDLIAGTAEAVSALRLLMDEPAIVDAFPGQRNRP